MRGNDLRELRKGDVRKIFLDGKATVYKCSYCALAVDSKTVERHLANHTREVKGQFTCKYCCYTSDTSSRHEAQHHKYLEKPHKFRCEECTFAGDSQIQLDSHLSLNLHKEQQFGQPSAKEMKRKYSMPLPIANSASTSRSTRKKFMFRVRLKNVYRCSFCGMSLSSGKAAMHIQRHQIKSDDHSTCKYCSFSSSASYIGRHQILHEKFLLEEHKFRCHSCNFAGDIQLAMDAHLLLGLHGKEGGESSTDCQKWQELEQEEEEGSNTGDRLRHGTTTAFSANVAHFRLLKGLKMARKIGGGKNCPTLCLLCGMTVNHGLSHMKEHERNHYRMTDTDNLKKCDYCSYVSTSVLHNKYHKIFLSKCHKFVCGMCNFVCDYKNLLHLHQETTQHEGESNDNNYESPNPVETSDSDDDEVAVSPPEDMKVCSDTSNISGPNSEEVKQEFPTSSTSNHTRLVSQSATESLQQRSIHESIKTEEDDIEIISVVPPNREVAIQRQTVPDIFRCPFCPFLVNVAEVMMIHLYSHTEDTRGQLAPQQPAHSFSLPLPFGATAQPQLHPQALLQPSHSVPQQIPYWQPQTSGMMPQQIMNQVAYPQAALGTQYLNHL